MFHDEETVGSIHVPYNWSYADTAAREAATGFVTADIGKLALQEDDNTLWILTAITPTWVAVGVPQAVTSVNTRTGDVVLTADDVGECKFAADAGSTDAYAITLSPAITAYTTGVSYRFKANTANTGAATLDINGVGAQAIKKVSGGVTTALDSNDIRAGQMVEVVWDGTNFQMISALGTGMANPMTTAGDIITGGASGTPTRLAMGSALQVLRVNAGATALEFAAPSGGGGSTDFDTGALSSDDTKVGLTLTGLNAGATIAQWEAVYIDSSSTYQLADANGSGTYPARGLAVAAYVSTDPAVILREGIVRNDAWNWTPGGTIYLSTTAGGLTQTAPSASGDKIQQVGFALTADIAYLNFGSGEFLTVP
jgi:hypothetical protein